MKQTIIFLILIFLVPFLYCEQEYEKNISRKSIEHQITISRNTIFFEAIKAIESLSQQFEGRKIINMSGFTDKIGIPVRRLHWKDALSLIVGYNHLVLEERPGAYVVKDIEIEEIVPVDEEKAIITTTTKQVRISSVFFKADKSLSQEVGINWTTILRGEVDATVDFSGGEKLSDDIINASVTQDYEAGNVTIKVDALLRILEAYQKGTVIARPSITVLSGKKGFIQVGQDFSVKSLDDAGNIIEKFFETGIILEVTPRVLIENEREAIHLAVKVEKSDAIPGDISTIINKSKSSTDVLLFDGEETVIGGLYDIDTKIQRSGIPILKDLPWWVFGLKYIFGFNSTIISTNEMIIILKAELLDNVEKRKSITLPTAEQIQKGRKEDERIKKLFQEDE